MAQILIVSALAETVGLAIRLMAEGHTVKYYIHSPPERDCGDGFLEKVPDWREHVAEADLVFFDDVRQKGAEGTTYDAGKWFLEVKKEFPDKLVIGGSPETARLENDRVFGQETLAQLGVPVVEMRRFTDFKEAAKFVQETGKGYAIKHNGQVDRDLTAVFFTPEETVEFLEWLAEVWPELGNGQPVDFVLQEAVRGIELAVTCFFDGEQFRSEACYVNQEVKKELAGDLGRSTGQTGEVGLMLPAPRLFKTVLAPLEPWLRERGYCSWIDLNCIVTSDAVVPLEFTCYDAQTEVLTASGWKRFPELRVGELVATLNPNDGVLEYRPVTHVIAKPYRGKMVRFRAKEKKHSAVDLLVTPDHSMWVRNLHRNKYEFVPAERVAAGGGWQIKRTAIWKGEERPTFTLPSYMEKHVLGRHGKIMDIEHPAIEMKMETWLRFLGLYLSEGSTNSHQVRITQAPDSPRRQRIREMLADFPLPIAEDEKGFLISSVQLTSYLKPLGKCSEKFIPAEFKMLAPRYLEVLLDAFAVGDGSVHKRTGQLTFYTTSERLAGDIQELLLKTGKVGFVRRTKRKGTAMTVNGKTYVRKYDALVVSERRVKLDGYIDRRLVDWEEYSGMVYCCTVPPHHLLYVRRNGTVAWCGNCRPGYPTVYTFCELLDEPVGGFLLRMAARDQNPIRAKPDMGVAVVLASGTFPDQHPTRNKLTVVHGLGKTGLRHVWLSEVRWDGQRVRGAGELGYLAVVTGSGSTIEDAAKRCYAVLEQISVTPFAKYRTDIGDKAQRDFPQLLEWGWLF